MSDEVPTEAMQEWILEADSELRFEVPFDKTVHVMLQQGLAEIFGSEMAPMRYYKISGAKLAVFTHSGAQIQLSAEGCGVVYKSSETPVYSYVNLHTSLEQQRQRAVEGDGATPETNTHGPRVLIVGAGRTSLAKTLINYAVRVGRRPAYVDTDVVNGSLMFPGVLSVLPMDRVIDIEEGFPTSNAAPLAYFYGHVTISENVKQYNSLVKRLGESILARMQQDKDLRHSGIISVAPAWDDSMGMEILQNMVVALSIDVVVVLGNERLFAALSFQNTLPKSCTVLKLAKSGGVVVRDSSFRRFTHMQRIREYFYGFRTEFSPHSLVLGFKDITVFRVGEGPVAPSSALPIGAQRKVDEARLVKVDPATAMLMHSVLALVRPIEDAENATQQHVSNCIGFVYVSDVHPDQNRMTVLTPCAGRLPSTTFILGTVKWLEV